MKPEWKEAPAWAEYLAMDGDGWWCWYSEPPLWDELAKEWILGDDEVQYDLASERPDASGIDWDFAGDTLEGRSA